MKKYILILTMLTIIISCSKDNNDDDDDQHCNFNTEIPECCFNGSDLAARNQSLQFTNRFPGANAQMEWEILAGDMSIIDVENSVSGNVTISVATIMFDNNFETGRIKASGVLDVRGQCAHYHNVRLSEN